MFQRPLICTDFADNLQRLVHFVPSLAAGGMKHITFLNVVPLWKEGEIPREDTAEVNQARDRLQAALQQVPEDVEVRVEVESGRAIETILKVAKTHQADVIILGTPTRSLLNEKLFGSTTMELAQRVKIPLLVLRPQLLSAYTTEELNLRCQHLFRNLLIPYDNSGAAQHLIEQIQRCAQAVGCSAPEQGLLCWVLPEGGRQEFLKGHQKQEAIKILAAVQAELQKSNIQTSTEVRSGNAVQQVLEVALMSDATAIAVASDSMGRLLEWSGPSFTGELLRRSWHPVLVFPPTRT
jgi:nucleotide-binding universal stress UspA family protein